ncbi:hypothetical protein ABZ851_03455 [Streptomyces sp. NPDC047049]|uniref:hypothetical protein n=1 Tax=Streptomyces sp. NPDC047049 TaxID=3156688 RepID=UPI0033CB969A
MSHALQDSAAEGGAVQEGAVGEDAVQEGAAQEDAVQADAEPWQISAGAVRAPFWTLTGECLRPPGMPVPP